MTDLGFRRMRPEEASATRDLVEVAFAPEDVPTFLDGLRAAGCILGEWVAEEDGVLAGHVVFNRIGLVSGDGAERAAVMLTPLAVVPERQGQGIGTGLTRAALAELEADGEDLFFVLGHKDYYPRFGFRPVDASRIASRWGQTPHFMVRGADVPEGRLVLPQIIEEAD
ncbi:GNAT family N-acetyltransferase [Aestuariibius insulae]|uniref:GNAT family N-acetyltransferase n=1 Tax=Aestuariibius insulae TaxID=2058287 RepID=UPI00345E998C